MHTKPDFPDPNLVGYWDFDEGEGQVAGDSSLYGNDGQLGSGPGTNDSDPNWTDSIAPIGICSLEEIAEQNLLEALNIKLGILDELDRALAKEQAVLEMLQLRLEGWSLKKSDLNIIKQKVRSAIRDEEQAEIAVDTSIGKVEEMLDALE